MPSSFQLLIGGAPADDDINAAMVSLHVEENADMPDAIQLTLSISRDEGSDLGLAADSRLGPFANVAVLASAGDDDQCIFDGYVLSHQIHIESGIADSRVVLWGQDASWLMNLEEKVVRHTGTDGSIANSIFQDYGFDADGANTDDDSPDHNEDGRILMQRATDIQFLRLLARRSGKWCRVFCRDRPGQRVGRFAKPDLSSDPVATLVLTDPERQNVSTIDLDWDVTRPTEVVGRQALLTDDDEDGAGADVKDAGLRLLDSQGLADFAGRTTSVLMTTTVDDESELETRARSILRDAGWWLRCSTTVDVNRTDRVLRVGDLVQLEGIGQLYSGRYLVWSVRHEITQDSHKMRLNLVRNAIGSSSGSSSGLPSALGSLV